MPENKFGEVIKQSRLSKGLSLRELAKRIKISHPYLSQLENGKNDTPSIGILKKLSSELGLPFFYLSLLSSTDIGLKKDIYELAKEYVVEHGLILFDEDFFKNLGNFQSFSRYIKEDVLFNRDDVKLEEGYLEELYSVGIVLKEIEERYSNYKDSLMEAFGFDRPSLNNFIEESNGLLAQGQPLNFPVNDLFFHLNDKNNKKSYKTIVLSNPDREEIKNLIENYLIRKLSNEEEDNRELIKIIVDDNFRFPDVNNTDIKE